MKQHHEIIPANVAEKVQARVDDFTQHLGEHQNDIIAPAKTIGVVIGFKGIEVGITGNKRRIAGQEAVNVLVDRYIPRELR